MLFVPAWVLFGLVRIEAPFHPLVAAAQTGVMMEFLERGLPLPQSLASGGHHCLRDGHPNPELHPGAPCWADVSPAEGGLLSRPDVPWSRARAAGVILPRSFLDSGFFSRRVVPYIEDPCLLVREVDQVIAPAARQTTDTSLYGTDPYRGTALTGVFFQDVSVIRRGFNCETDGGLRQDKAAFWREMEFRFLFIAENGPAYATLILRPRWQAEDFLARSHPASLHP